MIIGAVAESSASEKRVAISPQSVKKLLGLGYDVIFESGCGDAASFDDASYEAAGAKMVPLGGAWSTADIILKVAPPIEDEIHELKTGANLISFLWPARNEPILNRLNRKQTTAIAMDCVPRISRAQKLDALSSMANIAGYRAVIEAANCFGSFFTGQITAAGKVPPAKVLVIGAGVAGLSAIGTARSLGAIVRAFDTRLAVKDQIKSMGAEFLELDFSESGEGTGGYAKTMSDEFIAAEMELFAHQAKEADIIITTALIPGKVAPRLITVDMVRSMKPGSVIVDLAAEQGGNCELTEADRVIRIDGVTIIGYTDLPSRLPTQSSKLYANNIANLLADMTPGKDGNLMIDLEDQVIRGCVVTYQGNTIWPPPFVEPPRLVTPASVGGQAAAIKARKNGAVKRWAISASLAIAAAFLIWFIGYHAPPEFVSHFTVFVLACFVGWQLVWNVTPALHTPLMSVTNAISGIIVIGGMLQMQEKWYSVSSALATVAVLVAIVNVSGGFLVTHRMLGMFRKQC